MLPKRHRNCCCRRCGITTLARVSQVAILSKYKAQAAWVHLKRNLITHGDREAENPKNIQKREIAITQLLTHVHDVVSTTMPTVKRIVIGGDFNTNHDQAMFAAERTLNSLVDAGYQNGFEGLALSERVTHPGNQGFPDATFDYVFAKGLTAMQPSITRTTASDHWPVTRDFRLY